MVYLMELDASAFLLSLFQTVGAGSGRLLCLSYLRDRKHLNKWKECWLFWTQLTPSFFPLIFCRFFIFGIFRSLFTLLQPAPHSCPPDYCALAEVADGISLANWLRFVHVLLPTQSALTSPPVSEAAVGTAAIMAGHSQHDDRLCYTATFAMALLHMPCSFEKRICQIYQTNKKSFLLL